MNAELKEHAAAGSPEARRDPAVRSDPAGSSAREPIEDPNEIRGVIEG